MTVKFWAGPWDAYGERRFTHKDGTAGAVQVERLMGGYYAYVYIDKELVASAPANWGCRTKAEAKRLAKELARKTEKNTTLEK